MSSPIVCCFGSSSPRTPEHYCQAAADVGRALAEAGFIQRNGAGDTGCMGALTNAAHQAGGQVEGVILRTFLEQGLQHDGLSDVIVTDTMRERKRLLGAGVAAYVVLPGGPGTWEEMWEVAVERQIGVHRHPLIVVNVAGCYDGFVAQLQRAQQDGLLYGPPEDLFTVVNSSAEVVPVLQAMLAEK